MVLSAADAFMVGFFLWSRPAALCHPLARSVQVVGEYQSPGGCVNNMGGDPHPVFEGTQLFELLGLFQRDGGKLTKRASDCRFQA